MDKKSVSGRAAAAAVLLEQRITWVGGGRERRSGASQVVVIKGVRVEVLQQRIELLACVLTSK